MKIVSSRDGQLCLKGFRGKVSYLSRYKRLKKGEADEGGGSNSLGDIK